MLRKSRLQCLVVLSMRCPYTSRDTFGSYFFKINSKLLFTSKHVQEPLGTVPDRVAAFESLALGSQPGDASMHDAHQRSGSRTPRCMFAIGPPYVLSRISETSERSHTTSVTESAFANGERSHMHMHVDAQHSAVSLTPRSMCHSVVSVDSDCTECKGAVEDGAMHTTEDSVATGEAVTKSTRPVVPTLQLKNLAFSMPSITEEALGCMATGASRARIYEAGDGFAKESVSLEDNFNGLECAMGYITDARTDAMLSMHEVPATSLQSPSACSNPFLDEQEPSHSIELEQSIHANVCSVVASVHTPRSDLVFGGDVPTPSEASRTLPTTQSPTPCMSLMENSGTKVAEGILDAEGSIVLPTEQPLTPLVDTITCGGRTPHPQQLYAQAKPMQLSGTAEECLKSFRCCRPTTFLCSHLNYVSYPSFCLPCCACTDTNFQRRNAVQMHICAINIFQQATAGRGV